MHSLLPLFLFLMLGACQNMLYSGAQKSSESSENSVPATLGVESFEEGDLPKTQCFKNMQMEPEDPLQFLPAKDLPRLMDPAYENWAPAAQLDAGLGVFLKFTDSREYMPELYASLNEFKAPNFFPLFLASPISLPTTPFSRKKIVHDIFWNVENGEKQENYRKICDHVRGWIRAQQTLRGKYVHARTRVLRPRCVVRWGGSDAQSESMPVPDDSIQITRLPLPIQDTHSGAFPIVRAEDCLSLESLRAKLK